MLILEPCELLRRLVALVPPPRSHLVRYHGVFGPASAWRSQIVPRPEEKRPGPCPANAPTPPPETTARGETSRIPWAELLLRVFRDDVLLCPRSDRVGSWTEEAGARRRNPSYLSFALRPLTGSSQRSVH